MIRGAGGNTNFFKETFNKHQTLEQLSRVLVEVHSPNNLRHAEFSFVYHLGDTTLEHLDLIPGILYLSQNRFTSSKAEVILS